MTHLDILRNIKEKNYHPLYLFYGEESYYIDLLSKYMEENVLDEASKAFNLLVVYGKDANAKAVIDMACRYPMMASHQLVILKEAQEMKDLQALEPYFEKMVPTTLLVICYKHKKLDKRTSFAKKIIKSAMAFESKRVYENKMPKWIADYLKGKKFKSAEGVNALLSEFLGNNLTKVANELDKLCINLKPGTEITLDHVQEHIGISKDFNVFELQKAIGFKDEAKAMQIVRYFVGNPRAHPHVMILGPLSSYFTKIYQAHFQSKLSDRDLAKEIGVGSPFFIPEYRQAMRNYPLAVMPRVF
ncbi:MAG: DNA polymerase III subunit delta, partial [Saprospiraceae bacterium]|nr:DNA polymerase III subunit delta [Saprospiraceae bacterium]